MSDTGILFWKSYRYLPLCRMCIMKNPLYGYSITSFHQQSSENCIKANEDHELKSCYDWLHKEPFQKFSLKILYTEENARIKVICAGIKIVSSEVRIMNVFIFSAIRMHLYSDFKTCTLGYFTIFFRQEGHHFF